MPPSFGSTNLAPGDQLSGRYDIRRSLGEGGMGQVFLARDLTLDRDVAIKVLPPALTHDEPARARFRREALSAAALDHPFICKIFEIGDAGPRAFIVMELVPGETLQEILTRGPVPPGDVVALGLELTDALEAAHGRGIVHRDLKPGNVMVTPQRHAKLMDFGLATVVTDDSDRARMTTMTPLTGPGTRIGTPAYMSPEQVAGDALDHRSDLFSLGVLLIEALTGVHPFMRDTTAGTMTAVLNDPPFVHATAAIGDMPQSLRAILLRMLAKAPDARYQSAAEIRSDLHSLQTPRPGGEIAGPHGAAGDPARAGHRWAMVGRHAERAELGRHLEATLAGRGGVVLIGGEPGIGKTRLTEELLADARHRGATGVVGHCYEMQGAPPYVPFVEITEHTARTVPPAALRRLLGDDAAEVTRLLPDLRRMFPDIPTPIELPAEQQRWYFFKAYCSYVDRATRIAPIVAVFEDLHWADEPTLQLLLHVAQSVSTMPLLIVGTYRDVELDVSRPFAKVLEVLLRQRLATRIALRRLPESDVAGLLKAMSGGRPAPASLARIVFRETEGNPFFVEEVFQHLKEEGLLFGSDGDWKGDLQVESLDVPEGVRLVIGRRLERLGENGRRILTTAAVIGRVFSLALLEDIEPGTGNAGPDAVLEAIEEAERAHLVTAHGGGRDTQYKFAHELIRQTLADTVSLPRRQRLHARIATAMEHRYASQIARHTSALAHHLYQAGASVDADKTTAYLVEASDLARAAAGHEEALGYLDRAISLWDDDRSARMADLAERRAATLLSLGRHTESLEASREACALWQRLVNHERYEHAHAALTRTLLWIGEVRQALVGLDRARVFLADAPGPIRAAHLYQHAEMWHIAGGVTEGAAMIAEADTLRQPGVDPVLDARALQASADIAWAAAESAQLEEFAQRAKSAWLALDRPSDAVEVAWKLVWALIERSAFDEAAALNAELTVVARRIGHHGAVWTLGESRAGLALIRGDLAGAEREARDALEYGRAHRIPWSYFSENRLGGALFYQGRVDEGLAALRRAAEAEPPSCYSYSMRASLFRCLAYADPGEARRYFNDNEIPLPIPGERSTFGRWLSLEAVAVGWHVLGERERLAALEPLIAGSPREDSRTMFHVPFGVLAGMIRAAGDDWDRAEAHFRVALTTLNTAPDQVAQGTAREWYADMLTARSTNDDRARASALYAEALAHYERLGLVMHSRHLRAKLAAGE